MSIRLLLFLIKLAPFFVINIREMIQTHIKVLGRSQFFLRNSFYFAVAATSKPQKTLYQTLQIPSTAPQNNIRKNYLKLAKIFHPDVYKGSDKGRFEQIKKAYEILSDVRKRQQYDEQIGIRKRSVDQTASQFRGVTSSATEEELNKRNDFTYDTSDKQAINLDQEYEKFFKKKKQTDFEQIRLHEQAEFREMSEKERMRFRVRELYTDDGAQMKIDRTKKFEDLLDDQIDQRNVHHQDVQKLKQTIEKLHSEEGIKKQKTIVYAVAIIAALIFYPLFFSFWTKYKIQQQQKRKVLKLMEDMRIKAEQADIRSRFQY